MMEIILVTLVVDIIDIKAFTQRYKISFRLYKISFSSWRSIQSYFCKK